MLVSLDFDSQALTDRQTLGVQLLVSAPDKTLETFGSLRGFLRQMTQVGWACRADPYEHGIDIACAEPEKLPMVYLQFDYEPGPNPAKAFLGGLRVNGRNGGEAPAAQWLSFMIRFTHLKPKPARY